MCTVHARVHLAHRLERGDCLKPGSTSTIQGVDVFERQHFHSGSVGSAGFNLILFLLKVFQTDVSLFLYLCCVFLHSLIDQSGYDAMFFHSKCKIETNYLLLCKSIDFFGRGPKQGKVVVMGRLLPIILDHL